MNSMWVPLIASIGVGAATYYSVSKNRQDFNQALQDVLPVVSHMSNGGGGNNGNNFQATSNMATNQLSSNTEQLGPYGMS